MSLINDLFEIVRTTGAIINGCFDGSIYEMGGLKVLEMSLWVKFVW